MRSKLPTAVPDALKTATTQTDMRIAKLRTELTATIDANQRTLSTQLADQNTRLLRLESPVTGRPANCGTGHLDASDA